MVSWVRLKIESKREQAKPWALIANQKDLLAHLLLCVTKSLWQLEVADENPSLWSATESLCWGEASRPRFASDIFPCCSNPVNAGTWRDLWRTAREGPQGAAFKTSREGSFTQRQNRGLNKKPSERRSEVKAMREKQWCKEATEASPPRTPEGP